jgi:hypothetical protein
MKRRTPASRRATRARKSGCAQGHRDEGDAPPSRTAPGVSGYTAALRMTGVVVGPRPSAIYACAWAQQLQKRHLQRRAENHDGFAPSDGSSLGAGPRLAPTPECAANARAARPCHSPGPRTYSQRTTGRQSPAPPQNPEDMLLRSVAGARGPVGNAAPAPRERRRGCSARCTQPRRARQARRRKTRAAAPRQRPWPCSGTPGMPGTSRRQRTGRRRRCRARTAHAQRRPRLTARPRTRRRRRRAAARRPRSGSPPWQRRFRRRQRQTANARQQPLRRTTRKSKTHRAMTLRADAGPLLRVWMFFFRACGLCARGENARESRAEIQKFCPTISGCACTFTRGAQYI